MAKNETEKKIKDKCAYPNCEKKSKFLTHSNKQLCPEHYELWNFICELIFGAKIEVNPYENRFEAILMKGGQS
jgi:hypothetical protein